MDVHGKPGVRPAAAEEATAILRRLNAPARLVRHGQLVAEAAGLLLDALPAIAVDERAVILGAHLHDAGKTLHPAELDGRGNAHERDGEALLLRHGAPAAVARMAWTHARWSDTPDATLEDLLVALADTLRKGKRNDVLENVVIEHMATVAGRSRWDLFTGLDDAFERIASDSDARLTRSRT